MAKRTQLAPETLEGVRFFTRNFSGLAGKFNTPGKRKFSIRLDEIMAKDLASRGWPVKVLDPYQEGDDPQAILEVKVRYPEPGERGSRPRIVLITSRGQTTLSEDMLTIVDWCDVANLDLIIRPYHYDVNGKQGITAYAKAVYVTIVEDDLELKYRDVPETAAGAIVPDPDEEEPPWEE